MFLRSMARRIQFGKGDGVCILIMSGKEINESSLKSETVILLANITFQPCFTSCAVYLADGKTFDKMPTIATAISERAYCKTTARLQLIIVNNIKVSCVRTVQINE